MSDAVPKAATVCPACRTRLNLPAERAGWLVCPSCSADVWLSTRRDRPLRDRTAHYLANYAHLLLLACLLISALATTVHYYLRPASSPVVWSLFCWFGFLVVLLCAARSRRIRSSASELAFKLKIIFGSWAVSAVLFLTADAALNPDAAAANQVSIRILLLLRRLASLTERLPDVWVFALAATVALAVLALPGVRSAADPAPRSWASRAIERAMRPVAGLVARLDRTRFGAGLLAALGAVGNWTALVKAMAVGVLAFGLSAGVQATSMVRNDAGVLEAFSRDVLLARVEWNGLAADIVVRTVLRDVEAQWRRSDGCETPGVERGEGCDRPDITVVGAFERVIYAEPSPYAGRDSGAKPRPDEPAPNPRGSGPSGPPPGASGPRPGAASAPARERLSDHAAFGVGAAWDSAAAVVRSRVSMDSAPVGLPRGTTAAQVTAARASLAARHPVSPAWGWLRDVVASALMAAESGAAEGVKAALSSGLGAVSPLGGIVAEFFDLFLTGPVIEEARRKAEAYLRDRTFEPVAGLAERIRAAPASLYSLRRFARYAGGVAGPADRAAAAETLRHELVAAFDRAFRFPGVVDGPDLERVRDRLLAVALPADRPFSDEEADRVMRYVTAALHRPAAERFDRMVGLKEFRVDTAHWERLRDTRVMAGVDEALRQASPTGALSRLDLRDGWQRAAAPVIMDAWLHRAATPLDDVVSALGGSASGGGGPTYFTGGVRCGRCYLEPRMIPVGPRVCLRPGQPAPCPDRERLLGPRPTR